MRILIVSQRFWPESFTISDIAVELCKRGHSITVLTGLPNYPKGELFPGYSNKKNRLEFYNGVRVLRVGEIPRGHNLIGRFLNYYSFAFKGTRFIRKFQEEFDVVLVNELSPIMCAYPAIEYKKRTGTRVLMYEMDLWPESLLAGGVKRNSVLFKHYRHVSAKVYGAMDAIMVSTPEHSDYIKSLPGCASLSIQYLPQYAEDWFCQSKGIGISQRGKCVFMFAGNLGKAQNLSLLLDAAAALKNREDIVFRLVGDGTESPRLREKTKALGLQNVVFDGLKPKNEMPKLYSEADVMIVSLEDSPYARMTIPGKVQTYMAAGKPILSVAPGATNALISKFACGKTVDILEPELLARACEEMLDDSLLSQWSNNAKTTYQSLFEKEKFFEKLIVELEKLGRSPNS